VRPSDLPSGRPARSTNRLPEPLLEQHQNPGESERVRCAHSEQQPTSDGSNANASRNQIARPISTSVNSMTNYQSQDVLVFGAERHS